MKPVIAACEALPFFPITRTQLTMLLEENICRSGNTAYETYAETPISFASGIRTWLG